MNLLFLRHNDDWLLSFEGEARLKANQDLLLSVFKGSVVSSVINVSELAGSKSVY